MNNDSTIPSHYSEEELGLYEIAHCWADETNNPTPSAKLRTLVTAVIDWLSFQKEIEEVFPTNVHLPFKKTDDEAKHLERKEQYRTKRHHFHLKLEKEYIENKMYVLMPNKEPLITDLDDSDNNHSGLYLFLTQLDVNNLTDSQKKQLDQILIRRNIFYNGHVEKLKPSLNFGVNSYPKNTYKQMQRNKTN